MRAYERGHSDVWKNTHVGRAGKDGVRQVLLEKGPSERYGETGKLGAGGAKSERALMIR